MSKYRFFLDVLTFSREVKPTGGPFKLATEREDGQIFFREKLQGSVSFTKGDYDFLLLLEQSSDRCVPVYFRIEEFKNLVGDVEGTEPEWHPRWKGKFSMAGCKFDTENCKIETPVSVVDEYTPILEEYGREQNILALDTTKYTSTFTVDLLASYEFFTTGYSRDGESGRPDEMYGLFAYVHHKEANWLGINREYKRYVYFREVITLPTAGERPSGQGWEAIEEIGPNTKYARVPLLEGFEPYDIPQYMWNRYPAELIFNPNTATTEMPGYIDVTGLITWGEMNLPMRLFWKAGSYYYRRNRRLSTILNKLAGMVDPLLISDTTDIISHFLNDELNPVTGEANHWKNAMVAQKSDAKRPNSTSEAATIANVSLKAVLEDLKVMANLYWFVNAEGYLQIEHYSYFLDLGIVNTIGAHRQNIYRKIWEYLKEKMFRFEKWKSVDPGMPGFDQSIIEYGGDCIVKEDGSNEKTYNLAVFHTDVESLSKSPAEYGNEGLVLLLVGAAITEETETVYPVLNGFLGTVGRIVPNAQLSFNWLIHLYHLHGRIQLSGIVDGVGTEFLSVRKTKKQSGLYVPACTVWQRGPQGLDRRPGSALGSALDPPGSEEPIAVDRFNPYAVFQTELSLFGELERAEHDLSTELIVVDVLHEAVGGDVPFDPGADFFYSFNNPSSFNSLT